MERVQFIQHEGRQILFLDFSQAKVEESPETIEEAKRVIQNQPERSLLTLKDMTNAHFNEDLSRAMKEFTVHNKPYVKAAAVMGITGLKRIIFEAVLRFSRRNLVVFDDAEKAKNWLVSQ